jgi:hypothetical protein
VGKIATLIEIASVAFKKIQNAPGKSQVAQVKGLGNGEGESELFSVPGVFGRPVNGTRGVEINLGGIRVIIATHNYDLDETLDEGETLIYAMDTAGSILGSILFNSDSEVVVNDGTDYAVKYEELKKVVDELQDDISDLKNVFLSWSVLAQDGGQALKTAAATWFGTPLVEDMANTKVEKVRLP